MQMIAYVDSSVILRIIFGETDKLTELTQAKQLLSSELLFTECFRTLDRYRVRNRLNDSEISRRSAALHKIVRQIEWIELNSDILRAAANPLSVTLGTLDAIHLVSAQLWLAQNKQNLVFCTHDVELARAGASAGLSVLGV